MRIIKFFLGSSISEFEEERVALGDFFNRLNNEYVESGVYFMLYKCEDLDSVLAIDGKQNEYNQIINECDTTIFLFENGFGKYTMEEFETALNSFKQKRYPQILVYEKVSSDRKMGNKDNATLKQYFNEIKHYPDMYKNIDMLKFKLTMELGHLNVAPKERTVHMGEIYWGKEKIASVNNIPIFERNTKYMELMGKLDEILIAMNADERNEGVANRDELKKKIAIIKKEMNAIEKSIFDLSEGITQLSGNEESLTPRQIEARRLLDKGELSQAIILLENKQREEELKKFRLLSMAGKQGIQGYVDEGLLLIDALLAQKNDKEVIKKAIKEYKYLEELTEEYSLNHSFYFKYAKLLMLQNRYDESIVIFKKIKARKNEKEYDYIQANEELASCYIEKKEYDKATGYQNEAINSLKKINKKEDISYQFELTQLLNQSALLKQRRCIFHQSIEIHLEAISNWKKLNRRSNNSFYAELAKEYNDLGNTYRNNLEYEKAIKCFERAITIRRQLVKEGSIIQSNKNEKELADSYNGMGNALRNIANFSKSIEMHEKALKIRRRLAEDNPEAYEKDVATSYNNLGNVFFDMGEDQYNKAKELYEKALAIRKKIAHEYKIKTVSRDIAWSYYNLGKLATERGNEAKAEYYYKNAKKIREKLFYNDQEAFAFDYASLLLKMGELFCKKTEYDNAIIILTEAIDILKEKIEKSGQIHLKGLLLDGYYFRAINNNSNGKKEEAQKDCNYFVNNYKSLNEKERKKYDEKNVEIEKMIKSFSGN